MRGAVRTESVRRPFRRRQQAHQPEVHVVPWRCSPGSRVRRYQRILWLSCVLSREFADLFIERITELVRQRPAYLSSATAPVRFRRPRAAKKALWAAIGSAFRAKNPSLSEEQSVLAAKVTLQMVSGLMVLYAEAAPKGKDLVVDEFKKVLTSYLGTVVYQ